MATSNCSNGLNGLEDTNGTVCCSDMCDFCGGSGCGNIAGTTANDCCVLRILNSSQYCGDDVVAPCILVNGTNTAAPSMTDLHSYSPTTIDVMLPSNCSNGLNGLEDTNGIVCCSDMCDFCGGSGCGSFTGTTANDCCIQEILSSGQYCGDDVVAPCILVDDMNTAAPTMTTLPSTSPTTIDGLLPSNCSNGLNGLEDTNGTVCCSDTCDFCGGSGCDNINGTTANDCCVQKILDFGQYCGDDVVAPCILVNDTDTAAPSMTTLPSTSPTTIDGSTYTPAGGESSAVLVLSVAGGIAVALVIVFLIAAAGWKGRCQRRSAGDYESNILPTAGTNVLSNSFKITPVPRAHADGSEISFDTAALPPAPSALSSGVKVSRKVEATMDGRPALVRVKRERKIDSKEEDVESVNEGKTAELLHGRENTFSQTEIQGPRKPSTTPLLEGWSSETAAAFEDGSTENHVLMDALQVMVGSAHAVASRTSVPLVAEIAGFLGMLANLSKDVVDNVSGIPKTIQWCRSMLEILDCSHLQNESLTDAVTDLLEDVYDAVEELVKIVTCFLRKGKVGQVITSSLCKKRQEEAEGALRDAMLRLKVDISASSTQITHRTSSSVDQHVARTVRVTRKERKQRMMAQKGIPKDEISLVDDFVLGIGGFSSVHLVEYQANAAAAKMIKLGEVEADPKATKKLVKMFVNEVHAMIELRSEHVVNVFGAVTTVPGALVLVMEFMEGGSLQSFLHSVETSLGTNLSHGIARDIAQGMALLHSKSAVHGNLKSSNVLLTRENRAKISDFGTVRTMEKAISMATPLEGSRGVGTTLKWAAPEVLKFEPVRMESDVYSYGIVVWEIMSREVPWKDLELRELLVKVLMGQRPELPAGASPMLTSLVQQCWMECPGDRLSFEQVLATLRKD